MLARAHAALTRVAWGAAACFGRRSAFDIMGAWFLANSVTGGKVKELLLSYRLSKIPALSNFFVFFFYTTQKAQETYYQHPKSLDLRKERRRFIATTEMILSQFKKKSAESRRYLRQFPLSLEPIQEILAADEIKGSIRAYQSLQAMHQHLKPHHPTPLADGVSHFLMYFQEYTLEICFDDLNLVNIFLGFSEFSFESFMGFVVLLVALISGIQAYYFSLRPHAALDEELTQNLIKDFLAFGENTEHSYGSVSIEAQDLEQQAAPLPASAQENLSEDQLVEYYVEARRDKICYLHY